MKKAVSILLLIALLFVNGISQAQTREAVIFLEGMEEPVTETLYESALGFSFWYDAELMTVDESASEDGRSLIVFPTESDLPVYLELMMPEAVGMLPNKFLEQNAAPGTEYYYDATEAGDEIMGFVQRAEFNDSLFTAYSVVCSDETFVAAYATYPLEAAEGFGSRFSRLLSTVSFTPEEEAVRAVWMDSEPEDIEYTAFDAQAGEPASRILFCAGEELRDFALLSLETADAGEDGTLRFRTSVLYTQAELTPDCPLLATLTFFGDIPNNGISYTDEKGFAHVLALEISGEDGSLRLNPIEVE